MRVHEKKIRLALRRGKQVSESRLFTLRLSGFLELICCSGEEAGVAGWGHASRDSAETRELARRLEGNPPGVPPSKPPLSRVHEGIDETLHRRNTKPSLPYRLVGRRKRFVSDPTTTPWLP